MEERDGALRFHARRDINVTLGGLSAQSTSHTQRSPYARQVLGITLMGVSATYFCIYFIGKLILFVGVSDCIKVGVGLKFSGW